MIDKKPKNYNEILRLKKCYTLTEYYSNITENLFNEIYDFLGKSPNNKVVANQHFLSFIDSNNKVTKTMHLVPKNNSFDTIKIDENGIFITPHYRPSTTPYWTHSPSSSNNNNNNNNNNNK